MNAKVLEELKRLNSPRINDISWPTREEVWKERRRAFKSSKTLKSRSGSGDGEDDWITAEKFEDNLLSIEITAEDIINAAKSAKRSTTGGLQQLTPWFLRLAVMHSPGNRCAMVMAKLANRWARGDFDPSVVALWAMGRLIPLFKSEKTRKLDQYVSVAVYGDY